MSEEKLISGRYEVNVITARKIKLYAMLTRVTVGNVVRMILEKHIEEVIPDSLFKRFEGDKK